MLAPAGWLYVTLSIAKTSPLSSSLIPAKLNICVFVLVHLSLSQQTFFLIDEVKIHETEIMMRRNRESNMFVFSPFFFSLFI